jgi:pyridoxal phosphate enzyme (YggS family)
MPTIRDNVRRFLDELPPHVNLMAVVKTRTPEEVAEAVESGVKFLGANYVQEAENIFPGIRDLASCQLIGHLQSNKTAKAVGLFDVIQTVDSLKLATEISKRTEASERVMPVLLEINSGREPQKAGVFPEQAEALVRQIAELKFVHVQGLMTMGMWTENTEVLRRCFVETKRLFEKLGEAAIPNVSMLTLSMGMSDSYRIAVEEGSNLVRIGTAIFGPRTYG